METLKAGYVSFGTMFYEPQNLASISKRAENQLVDTGLQLTVASPVYGEEGEPERAIEELKREPWDFLILNIINWVDMRGVIKVIMAYRDMPMVLYSFGGFTESGTLISPAAGAGSTALRFPMEQLGCKFIYLFNAPDTPMDVKGIIAFGRASHAYRNLKKSKIGMVGFNDMGLLTTGFNGTQLRSVIGTEVESIDLLQLKKKMDALPDEIVDNTINSITSDWEYPSGKPEDTVITMAIKLYLATKAFCIEKHFDGFSYKCVDGVDKELDVVHAVPASLLASDGIAYVDENDVGNIVAELALKWISGKQVMFLEHYEHHPEWILLGEDGYIANDFIEGKPQIKSVSTSLLGGIAHCSKMKTGRMTLACLSEDGSSYRMHIVSGIAKPRPQWVEMGVPLPSWPSVTFYPDVPVRRILDHVQSQHFAVVFGDYAKELKHLCDLLQIKAIIDSTDGG